MGITILCGDARTTLATVRHAAMWLTGACSPTHFGSLKVFQGQSDLQVVCVTTNGKSMRSSLSKLTCSLRRNGFEDIDSIVLCIREDNPRDKQTEFQNCIRVIVEWLGVGRDKANAWVEKTTIALYRNKFEPNFKIDRKRAERLKQEIRNYSHVATDFFATLYLALEIFGVPALSKLFLFLSYAVVRNSHF